MNVIINDNHLKDIADTIRSKNKTSTKYKPREMASAINELEEVTNYIDPSLIDDNKASGYLLVRIIKKLPHIETSEVTNMSYAFSRFSALEELEEIDCSSANNINAMFATCSSLRKMGGLKNLGMAFLPSASANNTNYTLALNNTILDHDSLINVFNSLYDIASIGIKTQTIRLSASLMVLLTADEIAIATNKGWTVTT
jgi:hypothetical protein